MPMVLALARRLATLAGILLLMTFLIFILQTLIPNDPARLALGPGAPLSEVVAKRHALGLDQPLVVQYARYLAGLARFDFGTSIRTHRAVLMDIGIFLPASLELAFAALAIGIPLGLCYGATAVLWPGAGALRVALIAASSLPIFLTALLLSDVFWFHLHLLPSGGRQSLEMESAGGSGFIWFTALIGMQFSRLADASTHLALPAATLMLPIAVGVGRTFAGALQTVQSAIYIRTARAKGLSEPHIFLHHMVRNAAVPVLGMIALQVAGLLGNLVVVERIFSWPGLGAYSAEAFGAADLPAIQGVALTFAMVYIGTSVLINAAQVMCDPRPQASR